LPNKNVRPINGHPLIAWSIRQALEVDSISTVLVSTDSAEIAALATDYGAQAPFIRPAELAQDDTPTEPVMAHAINWYESRGVTHDAVVLLQPTSPLRLPGSLRQALEAFESRHCSSLLSVCESHAFFWRKTSPVTASYDYRNRPRRQDIEPSQRWYRETGSIYVTSIEAFKKARHRLAPEIAIFEMREEESYEIDSAMDFAVVEALMASLSVSLPNVNLVRKDGKS
jgi:N-acylneuraminate cytidylyltransferase